MTSQYLDFDEAVIYLKTNASTLYKWLQAGKVPAHKLGRQWRFVKTELDQYLSGADKRDDTTEEAAKYLAATLERSTSTKGLLQLQSAQLIANLVKDAIAQQANVIQFYPVNGHTQIDYRIHGKIEKLAQIPNTLFNEIQQKMIELSFALQDEEMRSFHIQLDARDPNTKVQIYYQKIETVSGARITLRLSTNYFNLATLEQIVHNPNTLKAMHEWLEWPSGVIFIGGKTGNGTTTTVYAMLKYLADKNKTVFLVNNEADTYAPQISQIELWGDSEADLEHAIKQILASDADVIGMTFNPASNLSRHVYRAAYRAAVSGALVIVQVNASSCEAVGAKIKLYAPDITSDDVKVAVSVQELEPDPHGGRKAKFMPMELNQ